MRTLEIGVDIDGCLYDFAEAVRHWVHVSTGRPRASMPDATCWHFYKEQWGLSSEEFLAHYHAGVDAGVIFEHGDPMEGSVEALRLLKAAGHRLHAVTDRAPFGAPGRAFELTSSWLRRAGAPLDSLTLSADKLNGSGVMLDVFVEDRLENAFMLATGGVRVFLLDRPWNQGTLLDGITRVSDWAEIVERLNATSSGS